MQYECGQSEMAANLGIHFEQSLGTISAPVTEQQGEFSEQYLQDSSVSIRSSVCVCVCVCVCVWKLVSLLLGGLRWTDETLMEEDANVLMLFWDLKCGVVGFA